MAEELNPRRSILSAAKLAVAAGLLLSIGGYGGSILPSPGVSLGLLALLLLYEGIRDAVAAHGSSAAMASVRRWIREHDFALALGVITALALALRLFGITRDLGHVALGIDENRLNASILHLFRTGDIDYRTVEHYPGVHYWMLTGTYLVAYLWGLMADIADGLARMPREHFAAFGRGVSALQSTATVLITGLLGRRLVGDRPGLLAAGLLALAPLSVALGQQLRNDAAQTMLIVAAVLVALNIQRRGFGDQEALAGGALAGLAAGVKYTGVFVLLPVLIAAATSEDRARRSRALGLVVAGFLAAALMSNHFVWYDLPNLVAQLSDQIDITGEGHWAAQDNPAAYHVRILAQRVVGWPLMLLAAATTAVRLAAGDRRWWLFALYPLTYIWFVAQRPSQLPRWVYPAAPFVAVAAGAGLAALIGWASARLASTDRARRRRAPAASVALVLAFFAPMLWAATSDVSRQLSPPTWELTERWLRDNAAPGDRVLIERGWLDLRDGGFDLNRQRRLIEVLDGGMYALAANEWVVVHEAALGHASLDRLELVERIRLDPSYFGNQGPDFAIYRTPEVAPLEAPLAIGLGRFAAPYLGHEWPAAEPDEAGRLLPTEGAGLFLPPLGGRTAIFEVVIESLSPDVAAPSIEISSRGERLTARVSYGPQDGRLAVSAELALRAVGPGVVALRLRPAPDSGPVRVLGFRVY